MVANETVERELATSRTQVDASRSSSRALHRRARRVRVPRLLRADHAE